MRTNENKLETEAENDRSKFNNDLLNKRERLQANLPQQKYQNYSSLENEGEIQYRINQTKLILDKAQSVILKVVSSPVLQPDQIIKINPLGIEKSLRNKNDGIVYFGFFPVEEQKKKFLDFVINQKDEYLDNSQQPFGKFFQISFNPDYLKYYIKDCGSGFGTFTKIQTETLLKDISLINIGNSFISITLGFDDDTILSEYQMDTNKKIPSLPNKDYSNNLNLKIVSKNMTYDPMNFQPTRSAIRIGRSTSCEVFVEDNMLSRIHCTIEFRANVGWVIRDGNVQKNKDGSIEVKPSTNGTWFYPMEDTPINEGMIFKSNNSIFQCTYIGNNIK